MTPRGFSQGIEKILVLAKLDEKFRARLLYDREAALDECEISLNDTEREILLSISADELKSNIPGVSVPEPTRRAFLTGGISAAIAALAVGGVLFITSALVTTSLGCRKDYPDVSDKSNMADYLLLADRAQEEFKLKHGRYAKNIIELNETGSLNPLTDYMKRYKYTLEMTNVTDNEWQLLAIPTSNNYPSYLIDESGNVKMSDSNSFGPESELLDD